MHVNTVLLRHGDDINRPPDVKLILTNLENLTIYFFTEIGMSTYSNHNITNTNLKQDG